MRSNFHFALHFDKFSLHKIKDENYKEHPYIYRGKSIRKIRENSTNYDQVKIRVLFDLRLVQSCMQKYICKMRLEVSIAITKCHYNRNAYKWLSFRRHILLQKIFILLQGSLYFKEIWFWCVKAGIWSEVQYWFEELLELDMKDKKFINQTYNPDLHGRWLNTYKSYL